MSRPRAQDGDLDASSPSHADTSLYDALRRDGAAADLGPEPPEPAASAEDLVAALRRAAAALPDERAALAAWDAAGALHRPETLDAAITELAAWRLFGFVRAGSKRRLLRAARLALRRTGDVGSLRLAAAFVGELGGAEDVESLEVLAAHPRLALHAVTALAVLRPWQARLALLRVLAGASGEHRILVIDRLLPHAGQAAVRLALVRDALGGLTPDEAREVAADIAAVCRCRELADDPSVTADVRAGARAVLGAAATSRT
jgi:hypothetical protein